jgi:TolB protein
MLPRFASAFAALALLAAAAEAQEPLRIEITEGVIEPMPIALPAFVVENAPTADYAAQIREVIAADLQGTGLFRVIDQAAYISPIQAFDIRPNFADWGVISAEALGTGATSVTDDGRLFVKFQLWDVFGQRPMGDGVGLASNTQDWRRVAHKLADLVYQRLTGETGYFDTRVAFIDETGPKGNRTKRVAVMDYDGANVRYLTNGGALTLTPRFSPDGRQIVYLSYERGAPKVFIMDVATGARDVLGSFPGMTFAPRFAPDGRSVILSMAENGNTDLYSMDLASRSLRRLTSGPGIETAPSYSPTGDRIVFESDQGGSQQLYVMSAFGSAAQRISFGGGSYGTPVWSPRGDLIAFTKILRGRFHVGVMRVDGSDERLLTASFLDEAPTWAPNGRVLMFFRESPGVNGAPAIYRVDASGRNLRRVNTPAAASDPSWSEILN